MHMFIRFARPSFRKMSPMSIIHDDTLCLCGLIVSIWVLGGSDHCPPHTPLRPGATSCSPGALSSEQPLTGCERSNRE